VLRELRSGIEEQESHALIVGALALVHQIARHRREGSPAVEEVVELVRAFVLGAPEERAPRVRER
jgi:hypothetical protein